MMISVNTILRDTLLQLYRCVRMIPQPSQIFAQRRQFFLLLLAERLSRFPRSCEPGLRSCYMFWPLP